MATKFGNLFDIGPLFESEGPQDPEIQGLFGVDPQLQSGTQEQNLVNTQTLQEKMAEVNRETAEKVEEIKNEGMFARYPIVEDKDDEEREFARLKRRGLSDEEAKRRIEKFRRKGGRVKTSAKVMAAATMLGGAIRGYLAVKQGRPIPQQGALQQLQEAARARTEEAIRKAEEIGSEEKALILVQDEREFKKYLADVKADGELRKEVEKESRNMGQAVVDEEGNPLPIDLIVSNVVAEKARRAAADEEVRRRQLEKAEATERRLQSAAAVKTGIDMRDDAMINDRDIAEHWNIDPTDQKAINKKREAIASQLKIMSLQDQGRLIAGDLKRGIDVLRLQQLETEPPKETPDEKFKREMEEQDIKDRKKALDEYEHYMPPLIMGEAMFADDPNGPAIISGLYADQARRLMKAYPDEFDNLGKAIEHIKKDVLERQGQVGEGGIGLGLRRGE